MTEATTAALPVPAIRVTAFGEVVPTNGCRFVMGDFYSADQMRAALAAPPEPVIPADNASPRSDCIESPSAATPDAGSTVQGGSQ